MKSRRSPVVVICAVCALIGASAGPAAALTVAEVGPLNDHVLVKPAEPEDKPLGGIILPDTAKEKAQQGEVIAVGLGRVLDSGARAPVSVKFGDRVLFGKYAGTEVKLDGDDYLILREDEILAVLE